MKRKCPKCKRKFSEHLIQPMFVNGGYLDLCPLCALELRNTIHGLPLDTPFQGEIAQELYEEALEEIGN